MIALATVPWERQGARGTCMGKGAGCHTRPGVGNTIYVISCRLCCLNTSVLQASVLRSLYSEQNSPFWRNLSHANGSWLTPPSQSGLWFSVQLPPLHSGSWKKIFTFQIQKKWRPHSSGNMAGAQRGTPMIQGPNPHFRYVMPQPGPALPVSSGRTCSYSSHCLSANVTVRSHPLTQTERGTSQREHEMLIWSEHNPKTI